MRSWFPAWLCLHQVGSPCIPPVGRPSPIVATTLIARLCRPVAGRESGSERPEREGIHWQQGHAIRIKEMPPARMKREGTRRGVRQSRQRVTGEVVGEAFEWSGRRLTC